MGQILWPWTCGHMKCVVYLRIFHEHILSWYFNMI